MLSNQPSSAWFSPIRNRNMATHPTNVCQKAQPTSIVLPPTSPDHDPIDVQPPAKSQPGYDNLQRRGSTGPRDAGYGEEQWDSPAYEVLRRAGLMRSDWRVSSAADIAVRPANSSAARNCKINACAYACCFPGLCLKSWCFQVAEVPAGNVLAMEDGNGGFDFLGQGVHFYFDCFMRLVGDNQSLSAKGFHIRNGDRTIVEVEQGFIGLAQDMGQPVLLPPGLHQWQSATMAFERHIDLHQHVIKMGPYTLLTVDKGYDAVTQNNGQQQVLAGGSVHLLNHRNWQFEKFITRKIQTDDLKRIEAITGDNVLMHVDATVCWFITDSLICAERGAETMRTHKAAGELGDITKLRTDVLKQAEASLAAFIGKVNFSDTFSAAAAVATGQASVHNNTSVLGASALSAEGVCVAAPLPTVEKGVEPGLLLFDVDKLKDAVTHANDMTTRYGVEVLSINIISARPADPKLMNTLAQGAVAAAEAQMYETSARGKALAARIEAEGAGDAQKISAVASADALKITAQAEADAEVTRAEGSLEAGRKMEQSDVAVTLAQIQAQGDALRSVRSTLVLGKPDASGLGNLLFSNLAQSTVQPPAK